MKSKVELPNYPDGGVPSDQTYARLKLDIEELYTAIENNAVDHLVREALRPGYGDKITFHQIVAQVTHCVLLAVVDRVRANTKGYGFSVILFDQYLDRMEATARGNTINSHNTHWIGEAARIPS